MTVNNLCAGAMRNVLGEVYTKRRVGWANRACTAGQNGTVLHNFDKLKKSNPREAKLMWERRGLLSYRGPNVPQCTQQRSRLLHAEGPGQRRGLHMRREAVREMKVRWMLGGGLD